MSTTAATEEKKSDDSKNANGFLPLSFFKNHEFQIPTKRISDPLHINKFLSSPAYSKLIKFLMDLAESVKGMKISSECHTSKEVLKLLSVLDQIDKWVDEIEPLPIQSRYGNKAFRILQNKLKKESKAQIFGIFPDFWTSDEKNGKILDGITKELNGYFLGSFGNETRIDYGTGHELCFICFILIIVELRLFGKCDYCSIVLKIFDKYIKLMRKMQSRYGLEPAGTKGVWGLDDYQFLVFYFGAAQLINHQSIKPKDITNKQILKECANEYLYLSSIQFILTMKTGPFGEHSPLLFDISAVPYWLKVKNGLLKMYQDDVLKKLPVIQHFLFGSILSIDLPANANENENDEKAAMLKRKMDIINAKNAQMTNKNNTSNQKSVPAQPVTKAPWAK